MPAQPAVNGRAEETIADRRDNHVPDIQFFDVPMHWPSADETPADETPSGRRPADWTPEPGVPDPGGPERRAPGAGQDQGGGPAAAGVRVARTAGDGHAWPRQFAVLLAEALAGVRPVRQLQPWLSERGSVHLHRLLPLFADGHRPHVTRVLTTQPATDVIEMTLIVTVGPRTRALAVRLERTGPGQWPAWRERLATQAAKPRSAASPRWQCTDIEAA